MKVFSHIGEDQVLHVFAIYVVYGYYYSRDRCCVTSGLRLSFLKANLTVWRKDVLKCDNWPNYEISCEKKHAPRQIGGYQHSKNRHQAKMKGGISWLGK